MAHAHHHHGESVSNYFTEQLLTILVCGLIGFAAIQMYRTDRLGFLADQFRTPVLYGGIGVLVLVVLRANRRVERSRRYAAQLQACDQNHVHTPDCNHEHFHTYGPDEEHDHEHSHDLSWVFARMLILFFPVALYFLGLPNSVFSMQTQLDMIKGESALGGEMLKELAKDATVIEEKKSDSGTIRVLKTKTGLMIRETTLTAGVEPKLELIAGEGEAMRFNVLNDAALDAGKREYMGGKTAILEGRFKRLADKEFSLFRLKMTCCAADTVPLKVRIVVPQALAGFSDFDWVQVKGQIQFLKVPGQDRFIPVIMVADIRDVQKAEPRNEYEQ